MRAVNPIRTILLIFLSLALALNFIVRGTRAEDNVSADGGWPRFYDLANGGSVVIYQPQISSWDSQQKMVGMAAVAYQAKDAKERTMGTIRLESTTKVSLDTRLVNFSPFIVTEFNFPTLPRDQAKTVVDEMQKAIPVAVRIISLDRVLASVDKSTIIPKSAEKAGIKADPPKIFHSSRTAILVLFDGKPVWSPIKDNDLQYAVNTNWDLFQSTLTKTLYLRNDKSWLTTNDLTQPWHPATTLPDGLKKLPDNDNWKDVHANLPGVPLTASAVPRVFTSFEPAELILTTGEPKYVPVPGTSLLWVSNTEADVFRMGKTGAIYYLVAGRWFSAPGPDGPWTFATPNLPPDFKKIPLDHPRSRVLASVPGTDQAAEAVLLAQVPQTARVNKNEIKAPEVSYLGDKPEFQPIENTSLARAANTDKEIIKFGDVYYMCFQGVWFKSTAPNGPWEVTSSVPDEIYDIPASSPLYDVTYVKPVADDNPNDEWESFEADAGYTGTMVAWGCAVWGTGWYYPPYYWYGGFYPGYIWWPPTYGLAAWYNPYTGTFGRGAFVYGPYGGAGAWGAYNPRTGTYARGGAVYGPYGGSRSFAQAWNPRTGTYAATRQGSNVYGNWGSSMVQRGDNWVQTGHVTNYSKGTTTSGIKGSGGGGAIHRSGPNGSTTIGKGSSGDVYAGHDGNVYRKQDGQWQKWDSGGWSDVNKPGGGSPKDKLGGRTPGDMSKPSTQNRPSIIDDLNRESKARLEGQRRSMDAQRYKPSTGGRQGAGSYRPSGGRIGGGRMGGRRR